LSLAALETELSTGGAVRRNLPSQCEYCETSLRPVMITPSFVKDYRNPPIQRMWYEAERLLRRSRRTYIVGYSLPDDDLEVIHLMRRGFDGCDPRNITVVTNDPDQATRRRYISLFGPQIDWYQAGFEEWMTAGGPGEPRAARTAAVAPGEIGPRVT